MGRANDGMLRAVVDARLQAALPDAYDQASKSETSARTLAQFMPSRNGDAAPAAEDYLGDDYFSRSRPGSFYLSFVGHVGSLSHRLFTHSRRFHLKPGAIPPALTARRPVGEMRLAIAAICACRRAQSAHHRLGSLATAYRLSTLSKRDMPILLQRLR